MASELETAHIAHTEAAAKAEQEHKRYMTELGKAVGKAITVTGYPTYTEYVDFSNSRGYSQSTLKDSEDELPRTFKDKLLLDAYEDQIQVALWSAGETDPEERVVTEPVARSVFLRFDQILSIALSDDGGHENTINRS